MSPGKLTDQRMNSIGINIVKMPGPLLHLITCQIDNKVGYGMTAAFRLHHQTQYTGIISIEHILPGRTPAA
ncbi:hypothetical protein D3C80_1492520 [compost metagenome]